MSEEQRPGGGDEPGPSWAPFGPPGEDTSPEFDPPQTATPGPPPGAPPTPPPPTKPIPPAAAQAAPVPPAPAAPPPAYPAPSAPPPAGYGPPQYGAPPPAGYGPPQYGAPPAPPAAPYGGYATQAKTSGKAVASLVLGIAGWLVAPFILSVLGIIFGALARKEIAANPSLGGKGMANWGFWLSITGLIAWIVLIAVLIAAGTKSG